MTLKEANYEVEKLENDIDLLLKEKEVLESKVGVQSVDISKIVVDGGKRVDRFVEYVSSKELKNLDAKLQEKQERKENLLNWIDKELKILKKYDKVEQLIVYYKEIVPQKYTWHEISSLVHYSKDYCRKIYARYKNLRDI